MVLDLRQLTSINRSCHGTSAARQPAAEGVSLDANTTTQTSFARGDRVRVRARRDATGYVVTGPHCIGQRNYYEVDFLGDVDTYPEESLEHVQLDGSDLETQLLNNNWASRETLSRIVTFTKLEQPLRDVLYSFRATRTRFEPYQFKPLIKFLESPSQRLLIADEVGLGKTIEAGYILRELKARQPTSFRRVLVVCPAALRDKWRSEMERRFEERFDIYDAAEVRQRILEQARKLGDRCTFHAICSMQTLRGRRKASRATAGGQLRADWEDDPKARRTLLDDFEAGCPPLDLVIVDEAHHMRNPDALTHRLGHVLSERADAMVLMTATPIQRQGEDLFRLLNILEPTEFDYFDSFAARTRANEHVILAERALRRQQPADFAGCRRELEVLQRSPDLRRHVSQSLLSEILGQLATLDPGRRDHVISIQYDLNQLNVMAHVLTRTRKRDVQEEKPIRTPYVIRPQWTAAEMSFYEGVTEFCHRAYTRYKGDTAARFAVCNLQRQMASCIPAVIVRYGSPAGTAAGRDAESEGMSDSADVDEDVEADYSVLKDPEFTRLITAASRTLRGVDSKFDAFARELRNMDADGRGRKIVLFSFFKETLAYLERRLRELKIPSVLISGDVPSRPNDPENDERGKRVLRFHEDPEVRVLLSSEVGSEGLDFQSAAFTLVNYDLPWNPMVVEQRIGRLDRYGQPSKVIRIFNFAMSETIEDRVLERLYERIRIFQNTIGDLEPILGDEVPRLERYMMSGELTEAQKQEMAEQCLRAIETKRLLYERFEQESSQWVSQDEYFMEQVRGVADRRRYLTPEELQVFVCECLDQWQVPWRATDDRGIYEFTWNKALSNVTRAHLGVEEIREVAFLSWPYGRRVRFTFDSDLAYRTPGVELLSARHPLLKVVHEFYRQNRDRLHPAARVRVTSQSVPQGDYLYRLYLLRQGGAVRPGRYLEAVVVSPEGQVLPEDESEQLLYEMTTTGQTWDPPPAIGPDAIGRLKQVADEELARRRDFRVAELAKMNDVYVERRLASLRATYESKRQKMTYRLEQAQLRGLSKQYITMVEGSLRNIERDYESKATQLADQRGVEIGFRRLAAGVVRVER